MTKREWKRRYMHERQRRKLIKQLAHKAIHNYKLQTIRMFDCSAELKAAVDYFTKPPVVTDRCSITYNGKPIAVIGKDAFTKT